MLQYITQTDPAQVAQLPSWVGKFLGEVASPSPSPSRYAIYQPDANGAPAHFLLGPHPLHVARLNALRHARITCGSVCVVEEDAFGNPIAVIDVVQPWWSAAHSNILSQRDNQLLVEAA